MRLDAETATVTHPDGLTIGRDLDLTGSLRVKLRSVSEADFVAGSVPEELRAAVSGLPTYLVPKSPYYTIDLRTKDPVGGEMTVVIPMRPGRRRWICAPGTVKRGGGCRPSWIAKQECCGRRSAYCLRR